MATTHTRFVLLLTALGAACSDSTDPRTPPRVSAAVASTEGALLATIRQATARYHRAEVAVENGYTPVACHWSFLGGKGYIYRNSALVDGVVDPSAPEILNYEPMANGKLQLTGVGFQVPAASWDPTHAGVAPTLGEQTFLDPRKLGPFGAPPPIYSLNVWTWGENEAGIYSQYNPAVSCDFASAAETVFDIQRATTIGDSLFPIGDSPQGGKGQPIGGVSCVVTTAPGAYHWHGHLSLFVNGRQIAIPAGIGIAPDPVPVNGYIAFSTAKCFYELHTHDATGIIHLHANANNPRTLTLGQLFDVWGYPLTSTNVAGYTGPVTVYVNQQLYTGDPRAIPLTNFKQINLQVGQPVVTPPTYLLPPNT